MTETTANYDKPWKAVIGEYLPSFLSFFYPEIHKLYQVFIKLP
ncbi:hypothetical protein [Okeania sp. SIO1I7]|nr:hypothetical protein [Okeania sp. SIO1I7]